MISFFGWKIHFCSCHNEYHGSERKEEIIYQQILEYYNFHNQLNNYFEIGYNDNAKQKKEKFYFINSTWINSWKCYVNYYKAIKYINSYNNFIQNVGLNFDLLQELDYNYINSGESPYFFLSKNIIEINDFDCLVNQKTYDLFSKIFPTENWRLLWPNVEYIEGILFKRMLLLFINNQIGSGPPCRALPCPPCTFPAVWKRCPCPGRPGPPPGR